MSDPPTPTTPRGQITHVTGRNARGDSMHGLPKLNELVLRHDDGFTLETHLQKPGPAESLRVATGVCIIGPGAFPFCPICFGNDPADTREHVPPRAFGGKVMANTCARCNNLLGSRTESAMQEWFDRALQVRLTSDSDPKPFGGDRVFLRDTADGKFVLVWEKPAQEGDGGLSRITEPNLMMHAVLPHPAQYMTGLLKNAYLAACLHMGGVPETPSFLQARAELVAARDAKSRSNVILGEIARGLRVHRTGQPASGPTLALLRSEHEGEVTYLLSLAGTLLVEWPFSDVDPLLSPRMQAA